ncbi:MAG: flagellar basal body P-ring protein FlgI [Planctomycetes bacterium]|nr:flagellar basal body P-ring protein FlgI [Planctomycetota bacterium]
MLSILLCALLQSPAPAQTPAPTAPPSSDNAQTRILAGGVEAPAQPNKQSTSHMTTGARITPTSGVGHEGRMTTPIGSLISVRGQEDNVVLGIGLVTGLAGTGDSITAAKQLLANLLLTRNIKVDQQALATKNIAVVQVEAILPAGIKPGQRVDVTVSAIGDCSSLQGGALTFTELTEVTGRVVYATASGPVTVGGFNAGGQGASAKKNHTTVGTLPEGGKVEREVPTALASEHGWMYLDMRSGQDSLTNVVRIVQSVNAFLPGCAEALPDGKTVKLQVPEGLPVSEHVAFLNKILHQEVESEAVARVIINERTGVIVMGGDVRLRSGAIAQGGLTVTIAETPQTSQPGPLSNGTTTTNPRTDLKTNEENKALVFVPQAVTLQEVVDVLNVLGATPRDLISILQAMAQGGMLVAEIRRM